MSKLPNTEVMAARATASIWYSPVKYPFSQTLLIFALILIMFLLLKLPCQVTWKGEKSSQPESLTLPVKSFRLVSCILAGVQIWCHPFHSAVASKSPNTVIEQSQIKWQPNKHIPYFLLLLMYSSSDSEMGKKSYLLHCLIRKLLF